MSRTKFVPTQKLAVLINVEHMSTAQVAKLARALNSLEGLRAVARNNGSGITFKFSSQEQEESFWEEIHTVFDRAMARISH